MAGLPCLGHYLYVAHQNAVQESVEVGLMNELARAGVTESPRTFVAGAPDLPAGFETHGSTAALAERARRGQWAPGDAALVGIDWGDQRRMELKEGDLRGRAEPPTDDETERGSGVAKARSRLAVHGSRDASGGAAKAVEPVAVASAPRPALGTAAARSRDRYSFENRGESQLAIPSRRSPAGEKETGAMAVASVARGESPASVAPAGEASSKGASASPTSENFSGNGPNPNGLITVSRDGLSLAELALGEGRSRGLVVPDSGTAITVSQRLRFGADSTFAAASDTTIRMTGSAFENASTAPASLAGLNNVTMVFEGGVENVDPFEVAGKDMGPAPEGFHQNFALASLQVGGAGVGQVYLVNAVDNQSGAGGAEALYVRDLRVGPGSRLNLNGLNLYYMSAVIDEGATIELNGGVLAPVPEPASLVVLALGAGGVLATRRGRKQRASR